MGSISICRPLATNGYAPPQDPSSNGPRLPPFLVHCAMAAEVRAAAVPPVPLLAAALNCSTLRAASGSRHFGGLQHKPRRTLINQSGSVVYSTGRHDDTSRGARSGTTLPQMPEHDPRPTDRLALYMRAGAAE